MPDLSLKTHLKRIKGNMARMSKDRIDACNRAQHNAMKILKKGDRFRASRCGGIRATYTFSHWDGCWIVTRSGISDIAAIHIDRLNGEAVDFEQTKTRSSN